MYSKLSAISNMILTAHVNSYQKKHVLCSSPQN